MDQDPKSKILPWNVEVFSDIKLDNGVKYGVATECCHKLFFTKNPSIYNIIRWVARTMRLSDVPSIIFFMISGRILCKNTFNLFVYFLKKNTKIKVKSFECPKSIKSLKKIKLGTSDAWSTIRLYNWPSDPA